MTGSQKKQGVLLRRLILFCAIAPCAAAPAWGSDTDKDVARAALASSGVKGGLVVHIGCDDGRLTANLRANEHCLVHGLDADSANVQKARRYIQSRGLYGEVSADTFDSRHLPYADNLVNLIVAEDLGDVSMGEVMRVLAPLGTAIIGGKKTVKPWPEDIDEWTHYLHDATGNPVAHDERVGPPRRLQWTADPRWARQHDHLASLSAMVSSGGRVFYVMDEGSRTSVLLPPKWTLVARDAFNGVILWKRPLETWVPHLYCFKSGPAYLPRRLVAVGDRVYVTLGVHAPVSVLDATSGKTVRTYRGTAGAEELLVSGGVVFAVIDEAPIEWRSFRPKGTSRGDNMPHSNAFGMRRPGKQSLIAVEAATGKTLWRKAQPIVPMTPAVDDRGVFLHDGERVVCLDRGTGEERWRSPPLATGPLLARRAPRLVVYKGVVLFSARRGNDYNGPSQVTALSARSGEPLWTCKTPPTGHRSPADLLVAGGLICFGHVGKRCDETSPPVFDGLDPTTGAKKKHFQYQGDPFIFMHNRCHFSKATDRYLIPSLTGVEFADIKSETWSVNQWVRGGCTYGIMPCNGLLYTPPHACACFIESKLAGFNALAPGKAKGPVPSDQVSGRERLEKGPAYSEYQNTEHRTVTTSSPNAWPTFRHDAARSGCATTTVPIDLEPAWEADIGGRLSAATVAAGKLFVASVDRHTLYALNSNTGARLWQFTAGGRIDSPPTLVTCTGRGSLCLFGSADGYAYCLRASDGRLVWRFRVAPEERLVGVRDQLESAWPVHGSLLVLKPADSEETVAYGVAGRSAYLDGGMRLCRLDAVTGRLLSERVIGPHDPTTGRDWLSGKHMQRAPVTLPDVLSSDGRFVYMRSQRFGLDGTRISTVGQASANAPLRGGNPRPPYHEGQLTDNGAHLFSLNGFLGDSWQRRSYWMYASFADGFAHGWYRPTWYAPTGRVMVVDDSRVYGFGRKPEFACTSSVLEYRLFSTPKRPDTEDLKRVAQFEKRHDPNDLDKWAFRKRHDKSKISGIHPYWTEEPMPLLVRAMVLTGARMPDKVLFVAGPPDLVDEETAYVRSGRAGVQKKLVEQDAALRGEKGAAMWAVSAADGKKVAEYELKSPPVFDGMIAAGSRLYVSCMDGRIVCLARGKRK